MADGFQSTISDRLEGGVQSKGLFLSLAVLHNVNTIRHRYGHSASHCTEAELLLGL